MSWQLLPKESKAAKVWLDFIDDEQTKYFLLEGSVRSTKTYGSILAWCDDIENKCPPGPVAMMGNTRDTLIRNVIMPMQDLLPAKYIQLNRGTSTLTLFNRQIYLIGAPNLLALKKLQGAGFVRVYCDEVETYPHDVWQMLGTRTDAQGMKILATFNPGPPAHYLKKEYLDRLKEVNGKSWHFTLDDNPFLSERVKNELKAQYTGLFYQRYILGLWVVAEGAVYDFQEDRICVDEIPKEFDQFHVAVDYGITNPTHFLLFGHEKGRPIDNNWFVLKEWRWDSLKKMRQKTDAELSQDLGKFLEWHGQKIIPKTVEIDPSATSFIVQTRKDYPNLDIIYAINPVLEGIRTTSTALASGQVKINRPECSILLEEMGGYCWDEKAQENGEDAPVKADDHAMDALRYGSMRIFRYS